MSKKLKLGLTGNIGCGKSSVSALLSEFNIEIIDADKISREIYQDADMMDIMKKEFPSAIKEGEVDRKKLGEIVFSDEKKLLLLNEITHRKIKEITIERINSSDKEVVCIDAALLLEADFDDLVDKVIVVYCKEEIEIERIINRDGISKEEAIKRIDSQMSQDEKKNMADFIVDNSRSIEKLPGEVDKLLKEIKKWKSEL